MVPSYPMDYKTTASQLDLSATTGGSRNAQGRQRAKILARRRSTLLLCFQSTVGYIQNGTTLPPSILLRVHGMEASKLRNNDRGCIDHQGKKQRDTERGGWSRERFPFPLNQEPIDNAPFHPHAYFSGLGLSLIITGLGLSSFLFSLFFLFSVQYAASQANVHPARKVLPLFVLCFLFALPFTLTARAHALAHEGKQSSQSSLEMAPLPRASSFELLGIFCLVVIHGKGPFVLFAWLNSLPFSTCASINRCSSSLFFPSFFLLHLLSHFLRSIERNGLIHQTYLGESVLL